MQYRDTHTVFVYMYIYIMDDGWWMIGFWLLIPLDCGHRWG